MRNKLKTLLLVACVSILTFCIIWQIIIQRDPVSSDFPLKQTWKTRLSGSVYGISVADDEMVLVRTSASLYALNAKNGKIIWHYSLSWQADAKPAIAKNGKVYVTNGNSVVALGQETGSVLWQQTLSYSSLWVTDASESVVLVNQLGIDVTAFDANTGEFLWSIPVCRGYVEAFINDNNMYIPCDEFKAVDMKSGEVSWSAVIGSAVGNTDHSQDVVYYFSDAVEAYDALNQKTLWRTIVANTGLESFRVIDNGLFYTDDVRLCKLDIGNGHLEWCSKTKYPQTPAVIGDIVFVFDGNHKTITAFQIVDGKRIGELKLSNFNYFIIDRQLLASNKNLLFFSSGNNLYAYSK